jgi:hypothetical protein
MTGAKIPVLEVEKLTFSKDGRGLFVSDDGDVLASVPFGTTTSITAYASSATGGYDKAILPAASTTAWLKITFISGTGENSYTGYIPVFNETVL